ncbi:hypothetical protein D9M68_897240 [compost metagenome]
MPLAQATDQRQQALALVEQFGATINMHRLVVPGGHHFAVLGLARIEIRADVALGSLKDQ